MTALGLQAQEACMQPDINCDGYVNVNDLLGLLGYFGEEDLDGDGIWDSQDDCVDDGCGVCDGPGPQVLVIDTITLITDSIFIETINEWYVFEVPDTTFTFVCTNPGCTDPTAGNYDPYASENDGSCWNDPCANEFSLSFDGYEYELIGIGDQCWFAENLRTEHYQNGDPIPVALTAYDIANTDEGAQTYFENDSALLGLWGRMYNLYAVMDERSLCPSGWHVPSDNNFKTLEMELGMSSSEANSIYERGTDEGDQMKTTYGWNWGGNGTNTSGFSALPGGECSDSGSFSNDGNVTEFWTSSPGSTENGEGYWFRGFDLNPTIYRNIIDSWNHPLYVRCLKD